MAATNTTIHLQMWRSFLGAHFSVVKYLGRWMQEQHGLPLAILVCSLLVRAPNRVGAAQSTVGCAQHHTNPACFFVFFPARARGGTGLPPKCLPVSVCGAWGACAAGAVL